MGQDILQSHRPLAIATLVVLGTMLGGICFYRTEQQRQREIVETDLQTIAQLKTDQISAWRTERLGDAAILMENPFFVREAIRWLSSPSIAGREELTTQFRSLCKHYCYSDVWLIDSHAQVRLQLNGEVPFLRSEVTNSLVTAFAERRPVISALHVDQAHRRPNLDVIAPIFSEREPTPEPVGAVILQVDTRQFLYPLIQSWPTHSRTAETLLVTQDGDTVLFLNDLRYKDDAALKLRIPLTQTNVPAVMAVQGRKGLVEGKDYRGVDVLSVLKAIPDSQWFMVAKEDVAEAFSVQRSTSLLIVLLIVAFSAVAAVSAGIVWQRNQKTHFRSLLLAEQATRESEDKYRSLFESSRDAIMAIEPPSWRFTTGNNAAIRLFGAQDQEQFLACQPWQLSPERQPDGKLSADKAREMVEIAMREGSHFFEWKHKRLDGGEFYATVLISRIERNGGPFLQATVRDITDSKRAEAVTRARLRILMAAGDSTLDEIVQLTLDEIESLTGSSVSFYHFLQADQETLSLQAWSTNTLADQDLAQEKGRSCSISEAGQCVDCLRQRRPIIHNDGVSLPAHRGWPAGHATIAREMTVPIVRGQNIVAVIGVGNKTTDYSTLDVEAVSLLGDFSWEVIERKRAENELATTAARWDATFNSIADLVSVQDANHELVAVNKAYAEAFGGSPEELVGQPCHEIIHESDDPWPQCPCKTVFETRKPAWVEIFEPFLGAYLEVSVSPLFNSLGEVTGCVHIAKNITERKRAEEKQNELLNQLAAINDELNQFAYVVSHDLKAPLRAIRNLSDWLITDYRDTLDSQGQENLQLLGNRVERMAKLIDGVLQYSRAGRANQTTAPIDLDEIVPEIIASLDVPKHIEIHVDNALPTVEGDATRITQVFQNLLSNAIKYMDKPQGEVIVGCVEEDGYWKFSVSDNGPGIEDKHFDKIFQLFQTLAPRDTQESTGVGLAIIKKVVEMYGGRIWVESEVGQGSTFLFTLPRASVETSHAECHIHADSISSTETQPVLEIRQSS